MQIPPDQKQKCTNMMDNQSRELRMKLHNTNRKVFPLCRAILWHLMANVIEQHFDF